MKVDVMLAVDPWSAQDRARQLADAGVDGVFTFENAHDVFFPLVLAAGVAAERGLDLMTNVAIAFPRSPMHLAHAAWDLQVLSGGRFRLGLGSQTRPHIERRYGSRWSQPVERMRETVLALRAIFAHWQERAPLEFRGAFTTHTLMTPAFDPGPNEHGRPPILVGALGPRMTAMAAEVADGVLVMPFNSGHHFVTRTLPAIDEGLAAAGRSEDELEVEAEVIVAMARTQDDLARAGRGVRSLLAFYGSTPAYRPVLEVEGWEELQPELNRMSKAGQWGQMGDLIDERMLETLAVAGTPEECAAEIRARFGGRASRVCCYFPGYPVTDQLIADLARALHGEG